MSYDAKAVANYFIELNTTQRKELSPMKLQKLIYYAHGWHLAIFNEPLINENVEAWSYGPVIPSIYHEFKEFGNKTINRFALDIDMSSARFNVYYPNISEQDEQTKELLDRIWEVYSDASAIQLSNATHAIGTPWHTVLERSGGRVKKGTDIDDQIIKDFFDNKKAKAASDGN